MALQEAGVRLVAENESGFLGAMTRAQGAVHGFVSEGERGGGRFSNSFGEVVIGALRRVGEVAVDSMFDAGRAAAGFFVDSVSAAGEFESTLNRFGAVTGDALGAAGMEIEDFSELFLQMGADTQFSAAQAAEAAVNLAKGGLDPATIAAGGLEGALALAAAGEIELATAAEITAKQLGVWADQGVTAANVADLMAQAANASTVDVDELAVGLANVGGVAEVAGLSFEETVQTMALLSPGFSSASDAGTSFKTFLSRLIPTTADATEAMADLGLLTEEGMSVFYDATGTFVGMEEASRLLQDATQDLSQEERLLALQTIFGADAVRAAAAIAENGADGYNAMGASMEAAGGAAEQAALRNQGYGFALESLKGSFETFQIVVGSKVLPILTRFINEALIPGVNWLTDFAGQVSASETPMATFVAGIDAVVPGFAAFAGHVQAAATSTGEFVSWLAGPQGEAARTTLLALAAGLAGFAILTTVAGWISDAVTAFGALAATFTTAGGGAAGLVALLGGPVTVVLGAIALAVGVLAVAWKNDWGGIQDKTKAVWEGYLEPALNSARGWLAEKVPEAMRTLKGFWENTLRPAFAAAAAFIEDPVIPTVSDLVTWLKDTLTDAYRNVKTTWDTVLYPALQAFWDFVQVDVIPLVEAFTRVLDEVATLGMTAVQGAWQNVLSPALRDLHSWIDENVNPIIEDMTAFLDELGRKVGDWLGPIIDDFITGAIDRWVAGFNSIRSAIQSVIEFLNDLAAQLASLTLPDWLTPGSPPPLAYALWDVADGLKRANKGLGPFMGGMEMGRMVSPSALHMVRPPMTPQQAAVATYNQQQYHGPQFNLTQHVAPEVAANAQRSFAMMRVLVAA